MVNIPLDDGKYIIDTPGIVYPWRFSEIVSRQDFGAIMPEKPLKPAVYQLNSGQTLFFGGMARFDFVEGDRQSFTCFISTALDIHRTKLERADELYATIWENCCLRQPVRMQQRWLNGQDMSSASNAAVNRMYSSRVWA